MVRDYLAALATHRPRLSAHDLHWADPGSLDLLRFVARDIVSIPLLLLTTYRADESTCHHPLYALLPVLVREAPALRLDLHRLEDDHFRMLARGRYGLPDGAERLDWLAHLHAHAEGNPFYAASHSATWKRNASRGPRALVGRWATWRGWACRRCCDRSSTGGWRDSARKRRGSSPSRR